MQESQKVPQLVRQNVQRIRLNGPEPLVPAVLILTGENRLPVIAADVEAGILTTELLLGSSVDRRDSPTGMLQV
jgi:hypothetical protein